MIKNLTLPLSAQDISELKSSDVVCLSGKVFSARDAAHKKLFDCITQKQKLPIELTDAAIYYVGACPPKKGDVIGSCGPTTAGRMDAFTPTLLDLGVKVLIGKGKRSQDVAASLKKNNAVYFAAIGGAGAYYADKISANKLVCYGELLSEAIYELQVKDFPVVVAIDSNGNSIYEPRMR